VITENVPSGWFLDDIICSSGDVAYGGTSVTIYLDEGEHVSCEFVNDDVTIAIPTPTKPVVIAPTATPTKTPTGSVSPVQPPSAGDGGLLGDDSGLPWVAGVLSIVAASAAAWLLLQRMLRRSGHN
jgi:hypothetical protein